MSFTKRQWKPATRKKPTSALREIASKHNTTTTRVPFRDNSKRNSAELACISGS